ncbi:MAG: hypothetical protein AABX38_04840 [Candidatus Micrarchaeota archaeon]
MVEAYAKDPKEAQKVQEIMKIYNLSSEFMQKVTNITGNNKKAEGFLTRIHELNQKFANGKFGNSDNPYSSEAKKGYNKTVEQIAKEFAKDKGTTWISGGDVELTKLVLKEMKPKMQK